jgi:hypothetical protein
MKKWCLSKYTLCPKTPKWSKHKYLIPQQKRYGLSNNLLHTTRQPCQYYINGEEASILSRIWTTNWTFDYHVYRFYFHMIQLIGLIVLNIMLMNYAIWKQHHSKGSCYCNAISTYSSLISLFQKRYNKGIPK